VVGDAVQRALGSLPPWRLMFRGNRCTIGCNSPRIDEDMVEHLVTPCLAEIGP